MTFPKVPGKTPHDRFRNALTIVLSVTKEQMQERERRWREIEGLPPRRVPRKSR